ncbi:MAG: hypothetical protein IJP10_00085 [Clostridia bacterium]|nr:hypothetical protein [Clostridia bacterium]
MAEKGNANNKKKNAKKPAAKKPAAKNSTAKKKSSEKKSTAAKSTAVKKEQKPTAAPKTKNQSKNKKDNGFVARLGKWAMSKNMSVRIVMIVILTALLCYGVYQIVKCDSGKIQTETAQSMTLSDTISTEGYTVRDEIVIMSDKSGVMVPAVENGGKVSKDASISNVFSSQEAAAAYERIKEIDVMINEFESMVTASEDSSLENSLETQINSRLIDLAKATRDGELDRAAQLRSELVYLLNKKQIATKEVDGFPQRIAELKAERDELTARFPSAPAHVTSPLSGYYFDKVDGFESLLNTSMLETMTPETLDAVKVQQQSITVGSNVVGKIAEDYRWHIVCEVSAKEAEKLSQSSWYTLQLPYAESGKVQAKLMYMNPSTDQTRVLLVFRCITTLADLSSVRTQPIKIQVKSSTGLGIRTDAIVSMTDVRTVSGTDGTDVQEEYVVEGVYVMWGNEVKFRRIEVVYTVGELAVCREKSESGWLKRYDEVILNTEGMYDGKIVRGY